MTHLKRKKSIVVSIIAGLRGLWAMLGMGITGFVTMMVLLQPPTSAFPESMGTLRWVPPVLFVLFSLSFLVAWNLHKRALWARILTLLSAGIGLLHGATGIAFALIGNASALDILVATAITGIWHAFPLVWLMLPDIKAEFVKVDWADIAAGSDLDDDVISAFA